LARKLLHVLTYAYRNLGQFEQERAFFDD